MTDTTLKLTEAFNRHNSLYNALLGNMQTLTTAHTEEVSITLDAGKVRALTRILNAAPLDGDPLYTRVNVETDTDAWETDAPNAPGKPTRPKNYTKLSSQLSPPRPAHSPSPPKPTPYPAKTRNPRS